MSKIHKKVCVIGHFGFGHNLLNGQTVKTKILTEELKKRFPGSVMTIDTHGGIKSLIKAPFNIIKALKDCDNVVILPAHNGLRVYAPMLAFFNGFFHKRGLHYAVIGGWLPQYLLKRKIVAKSLKKFRGVYVETNTMKRALEEQGYTNILVMPNCKELRVLRSEDLKMEYCEPYRLCTFSRVMREKGIEDAVNAVKSINSNLGRTVYALDIYGQIDQGQLEWFEELKQGFPEYIQYGGLVPFDKSVEVLKEYLALLFPTRFYTEGIPGTIIDAYAAGVPVVSAKWESFTDIVDDGKSGFGYEFGNTAELTDILNQIQTNTNGLNHMKIQCLHKAQDYLPGKAIQILVDKMV